MKRVLLAALILVIASAGAFADLAIPRPDGAGSWYTGVSSDENGSDAFWDNRSLDGSQCNVGYWLQSQNWQQAGGIGAQCGNDNFVAGTSGPSNAPLSFLAGASSPSNAVGWEMQSTGPTSTTLMLEVAGWRDTNEFGYYTYDQSNNKVLTPLFSGSVNPGSSAMINVASNGVFGFYLCPNGACGSSNILFSGTGYSPTDANSGKFALFSENPNPPANTFPTALTTYWVGVEDTAGNNSTEKWGDFNDALIRVSAVPEPHYVGLLVLGLGAVIALRRRQMKEAA
jgi:hypothetical protein